MLPPERICVAIARWIGLLRSSSLDRAWALLRSDPLFIDLTMTQYAAALEWLVQLGVVVDTGSQGALAMDLHRLPTSLILHITFERLLLRIRPAWLTVDVIERMLDRDYPLDVLDASRAFLLREEAMQSALFSAAGKVDLAHRAAVGAAGETALVSALESSWPGSTVHVSLSHDGMGYDVVFRLDDREWHLEVKTTTRRASLEVFLSRHEHNVGVADPAWRLIVVGLDGSSRLSAVATVQHRALLGRAPVDRLGESTWQLVRHSVSVDDLDLGFSFLSALHNQQFAAVVGPGLSPAPKQSLFSWMPTLPVLA